MRSLIFEHRISRHDGGRCQDGGALFSTRIVRLAACTALFAALAPGRLSAAPLLTTLYTFQGGTDGGYPYTETFVPGPKGSLYGSSRAVGTNPGAVFQLSPPANGGTAWSYTLLQSFTGDQNGGRPIGLLAGPKGSLYGETINGGNDACGTGCGLVFQLSPPANGQAPWTETILYNFTGGTDGEYPRDGLVPDGNGGLFGSTVASGACSAGCGTVFDLSPPAMGQTTWTLTTLYTFPNVKGGQYPAGKLLSDEAGGFFGITWGGGIDGGACNSEYGGCGTIYHLTPPNEQGKSWKLTTIYQFTGGSDGQTPYTALNMDAAGNIFGMTSFAGLLPKCPVENSNPAGCGTVFELTPPQGGTEAWTFSLPWQFTGKHDGNQPMGAGLSPFKGKYITTTTGNSVQHFGSIDMFKPGAQGQPWAEHTLFDFTNDANGAAPESYLLERGGVFYGMTHGVGSGAAPYGTVFSLKP